MTCSICGEGGKITRGWCQKHYYRWYRHGDPEVRLRERGHGHRIGSQSTPIYATWQNMRDRVSNPANKQFADYGGRGIDMDPRYKSFENFLADMGEKPEGLTLDRIDNDKGYWPDNLRWADRITQNRNRRNVKNIEADDLARRPNTAPKEEK